MEREVRERLAVGEVEVLRLVAAGEPLAKALEALVTLIESSAEGTIGSVLLVDAQGRIRHGAGARLPVEYAEAIEGEPIGPVAGSCGTAAYRREPVVVEDIASDPLWAPYRDVALRSGLRACWSIPIFGEAGAVLGTFALYDRTPRKPTLELMALAQHAAVVASIAIQRHLKDVALAHSEARARMIIDNALDAHVMIDSQGVVREWCARAEEMFGFSRERALGTKLGDLIVPPAQRAAHAAGLTRYMATGESRILGRRVEMQALHARGHLFPVALAITKIVDRGEVLFSAFLGDLTAQRVAEAALRENDALLHAVYENVADVLFHLAIDDGTPRTFRFCAANPAFYVATGLTPERVIGRTLTEVVPDAQVFLAEYEQAIATRQPRRFMQVTRFATGERHGEITITPVFDPTGRPVAIVGTVHDMTDHVRLERELRELQRAEVVGRLSAGVAHDFNNILSVILLGAEMLGSGSTSQGHADPLREIADAARAGTRLTRQFLALSKKQRVEATVVDVSQVVGDLAPMLRRLLRDGVELELETSTRSTLSVVDPVQLEQAIINLVVNARDAIAGVGKITVGVERVEVDAAEAAKAGLEPGPHARVFVRDTGSGMSAEVKKRIFEPFFTTKAPGKGTGLGLATVDGFVRSAGGAIEVESTEGEGTTFTIFLRAAQGLRREMRSVRPGRALAERESAGRVLVVEDDAALRRMLTSALEQLRYEVKSAGSADEARTILRESGRELDLFVIDEVLPGGSGLELADEMLGRSQTVRILVVSGLPHVRELGAGGSRMAYLDKPFSVAELADAIHDLRAANAS